jgi:hypothetical protein
MERNLTGATLYLATAPAGATFSQRSLRKSLHCYIPIAWLTRLSFLRLNAADFKGVHEDNILAKDRCLNFIDTVEF